MNLITISKLRPGHLLANGTSHLVGRISKAAIAACTVALVALSAPESATATTLSFNVNSGSGHLDVFGHPQDQRNIVLDQIWGVVNFNTVTSLLDLHINYSGTVKGFGDLDIISAGAKLYAGPGTTRAGHEHMNVSELDALSLRGFADGRPGPNGNHGDAWINDEIGRYIQIALNNAFFAANPWENKLFIEIGRVATPGHVPGNGFLTLNLDPIAINRPTPPVHSPPFTPELPPVEVPEPASLALLLTGLLGTAARKRTRI